jgi:flavodoxin I
MAKIGLFDGTQTGNTESIADNIKEEIGATNLDVYDVADEEVEQLSEYEYLIIGCPTWNIGELQSDWDGLYEDLDSIDFSGKKSCLFRCRRSNWLR